MSPASAMSSSRTAIRIFCLCDAIIAAPGQGSEGPMPAFGLDAGPLRERQRLLQLCSDESIELGGGGRHRLDADGVQALLDVGQPERPAGLAVQLVDDRARRLRRRE